MRQAADKRAGAGRFTMEGLLQPTHLFFILIIVLIIFGPGKLPELGRSLGKGIREFKGAITDVKKEVNEAKDVKKDVKDEAGDKDNKST
jgi:sec-independent protein translocase protein TatA